MANSRIARRIGYIAFAGASLLFFIFLGFPTEALVARLAAEVSRQSRGAVGIKVGHAHLWRVTGVALEDVHVLRPGVSPMALEAVRLRLRLLPLLLLRPSATVQLPLGRGMLWGTMTRHGDSLDVHVEGSELDLAAVPAVARSLGVPLAGVLELFGDVAIARDPRHTAGELTLSLEHLGIGPGNVYGLSLPRLDGGQVETTLSIKDGRARLQKFHQTGGTLNLGLQGGVELGASMAASQLDACVRVRLDPGFLDKNPQLRSVMQLAEVQLKRDPDGFLNAPLGGPVAAPQLRPGLCPRR